MSGLFSIFNNLIGHLHANILNAIAKYQLYGLEKAKDALEQALAIGRTDGILLPFAEYGYHIEDILITLASERRTDTYFKKLVMETSRYRQNLEVAGKDEHQPVRHLTDRDERKLICRISLR